MYTRKHNVGRHSFCLISSADETLSPYWFHKCGEGSARPPAHCTLTVPATDLTLFIVAGSVRTVPVQVRGSTTFKALPSHVLAKPAFGPLSGGPLSSLSRLQFLTFTSCYQIAHPPRSQANGGPDPCCLLQTCGCTLLDPLHCGLVDSFQNGPGSKCSRLCGSSGLYRDVHSATSVPEQQGTKPKLGGAWLCNFS